MKTELIEKIEDVLDVNLVEGVKFYDEKEHGNLLLNIFDVLKEDYSLKKRIIKSFESEESIYADVVSSLEKTNCSCRKRVSLYFTANWSKCWNIAKDLFMQEECEESKLDKMLKSVTSHINHFNKGTDPKEDKNSSPKNERIIAAQAQHRKEMDELTRNSFVFQQNQLNGIQHTLNLISSANNQLKQTKPKPMGLTLVELFNILPNIEDIRGLHVTIQMSDYKRLFDNIKTHKFTYTGIEIISEEDILHMFFY